ncbi:MAG: hypothetical protein EOM70_09105, partial [Clostridia bacterium]|nr:hypothetical protein [Clostridia bacterium]
SATMLQQIFYKGSPLHDGAVVIRDGRISAARVHVPLSDNYHLRRDYGTRHRAAIGASEIGDTLAVVVSEERGSISLAIEGRLFILDNADALRSLLHKMLGASRQGGTWTGIFRPRRDEPPVSSAKDQAKAAAVVAQTSAESARTIIETQLSQQEQSPDRNAPNPGEPAKSRLRWPIRIGRQRDAVDRPKMPRRQRVLTALSSLVIAIFIWLYVQVTINPVISRTFSTQVSYRGVETAKSNGYIVQMPLESIQITLMGRQRTINDLSINDINAFIDLSGLAQTGLQSLPVTVDTTSLSYTRATFVTPSTITISVRAVEGN